MSFIDDLYLENVVAHDSEFLRGTLIDRVAGDLPTISGIPLRSTVAGRLGITFRGTALLSYADNAARRMNGAQSTFVFLGTAGPRVVSYGQRILSKRSAIATSYELFWSPSTISLFDGTNVRNLVVPSRSSYCAAMTLVNGSTANVYVNGVAAGPLDGTSTIASTVAPLVVGNFHNGDWPANGIISRVMLLSRALTAREVSVLYEELVAQKSVLRTFGPVLPPAMVLRGDEVFATDCKTVRPDGKLANLGTGGSAYDETSRVGGAVFSTVGVKFSPTKLTNVTFANLAEIRGASRLTLALTYKARSATSTAPAECLFNQTSTGLQRLDVNHHTAGVSLLTLATDNGTGAGQEKRIATSRTQAMDRVVFTFNGALGAGSRWLAYHNGIPVSWSLYSGDQASITAQATSPLMLGSLGVLDDNLGYNGDIGENRVAVSTWTPAQVAQDYRNIARTPYHVFDVDAVPVTLANVTTAGAGIPTTQLRVGSGQWAVKDRLYTRNGERKREAWVENIAAGWVSKQQDPGTRRWKFRVYRANTANTITVGYLASARSLTFDGYALQFLTDGGSTRIFWNSVAAGVHTTRAVGDANALALNTWYDIDVSLRFDGVTSTWYRKSGSKTWIAGPGGGNTTYTLGAWQVMDIDAADRLGGPCAEWRWAWEGNPGE
jgi:hypothetical protein